ncbi:MAG: LysE family translocator [Gammaproteobacteria bacterium]|nr:LysE family translocator [Gammaproteobacteria bacterium]
MELSLWLLFVVTFASALAIPGANAAYAIAQTLSNGPQKGLLASAGFAFATGLNIVIVLTGLGLILSRFIDVLIYLKWIGVCYLLYMAYKAFTADAANPQAKNAVKNSRVFAFAVMVSLSNSKVVLINIMLLPLFLVPEKSLVLQGIVIMATGTVLSFIVYSAYALIASKFISRLKTKIANRVVGSVYTGAGVALASINK